MKKIFQSIFVLAQAAIIIAACAKEIKAPVEELEGELRSVTFTATMDNGTVTKAAADGDGAAANVNRCIMEIYYGGSLFARDIQPVTHGTTITATFTAQVVANRTYTVAFWADSVAVAGSTPTTEELAQDLYYTTNADGGLQAIALKGTYAGNNDARDAFFYCGEYTIAQAGTACEATLKRPFAQINVITTDWDKAGKLESIKPTSVDVTINNPLTAFNALTGVASTTVSSLTYIADIYTSPTSGTDATLSMDYLFASTDKAVIDIDWKAGQETDASTVSHSFANIPYQRNYRTNIKGNLLTSTGQWTVTVDPEWDGEHSQIVEVKDIKSANATIQANATAKTIDIKFSAEPNDSGEPTGTESSTSRAILTTPVAEGATLSIEVASQTNALYVGDYEHDYDVTTMASSTTPKSATVNINVPSSGSIGTLVINAPSKSVYINGKKVSSVGTITNLEATTSSNTLVIEANQTVEKLTVHQGGLEIHGTVTTSVTISETAHDTNPVKVRECENLSQEIYDDVKDHIDTENYYKGVQHDNLWDIKKLEPIARAQNQNYEWEEFSTFEEAFQVTLWGTNCTELLKDYTLGSDYTAAEPLVYGAKGNFELKNSTLNERYTLTLTNASSLVLRPTSSSGSTLRYGTVTAPSVDDCAILIKDGGNYSSTLQDLVVNGTVIVNNAKMSSSSNVIYNGSVIAQQGSNVDLKGTFNKKVICEDGSSVTISGGEYEDDLVIKTGSTVSITDGTIKNAIAPETGTTLTFKNGTFESAITIPSGSSLAISDGTYKGVISGASSDVITITGGIFYNDPSAYIAEGYVVYECVTTPKTWRVDAPANVQNTTTGEGYSSLAYAIEKASSGDVIKLLQNFTETKESDVYDKDITLDLNSKTITFTNSTAFSVKHNNGTAYHASLILDDLSDEKTGKIICKGSKFIYFGSNNAGTAFTMNHGEIICNGSSSCTTLHCYYAGCVVTINGGKITNEKADYSGSPLLYLKPGTTATINGGELVATGSNYCEVVNIAGGTLNITGGTLKSISPSSISYCIDGGSYSGTINISGGTISAFSDYQCACTITSGSSNIINITGGELSADVNDTMNRSTIKNIVSASSSSSITGGTFKVGRNSGYNYTTGIDSYVNTDTHQIIAGEVSGTLKTFTVTAK